MLDFKKRVWVEIDLDAISHNLSVIKERVGSARVIAVVKADGYGHGAVEIANHLETVGVDFFAVSSLREAMELREGGIKSKILVLGFTAPEEAGFLAENNISQTVYSLDYAQKLSENLGDKGLSIHIKLNTGMNRLGFDAADAACVGEISQALGLSGLRFEGLFTHFAAADLSGDPEGEFTRLQYSRLVAVSDSLKSRGFAPQLLHCCNSSATLLRSELALSAVRPGIILYGLTPDADLKLPVRLQPAMTFKSVVSMVHTLKKGDGVSYGLTYTAYRDMKVATVTVGYADGYPRFMSNGGEVLIGGKPCKILGRVCMDQMVVDISDLEKVAPGDEVVLFGSQYDKVLPVEQIAERGNTINYEIVCGISRRVPRYYYKNGKEVSLHDYLFREDERHGI